MHRSAGRIYAVSYRQNSSIPFVNGGTLSFVFFSFLQLFFLLIDGFYHDTATGYIPDKIDMLLEY